MVRNGIMICSLVVLSLWVGHDLLNIRRQLQQADCLSTYLNSQLSDERNALMYQELREKVGESYKDHIKKFENLVPELRLDSDPSWWESYIEMDDFEILYSDYLKIPKVQSKVIPQSDLDNIRRHMIYNLMVTYAVNKVGLSYSGCGLDTYRVIQDLNGDVTISSGRNNYVTKLNGKLVPKVNNQSLTITVPLAEQLEIETTMQKSTVYGMYRSPDNTPVTTLVSYDLSEIQ